MLLQEVAQLSNGMFSPEAINTGKFDTTYTIDAERAPQ
jgi:hypothetical protein